MTTGTESGFAMERLDNQKYNVMRRTTPLR